MAQLKRIECRWFFIGDCLSTTNISLLWTKTLFDSPLCLLMFRHPPTLLDIGSLTAC